MNVVGLVPLRKTHYRWSAGMVGVDVRVRMIDGGDE